MAVASDVVHLGAVSLWLGGLVLLLGFVLRRRRAEELRAPALSRVPVLVMSRPSASRIAEVSDDADGARNLGIAGIVVGALGLLACLAALAAGRRRAAP